MMSNRPFVRPSIATATSALLTLVLLLHPAHADQPADAGLLTLARIHGGEFHGGHFGHVVWIKEGASYTLLEPSATVKGSLDVIEVETATGKRSVLIQADWLKPTLQSAPLGIEHYTWSKDEAKLLIFTNSQRVWRQNTRGDYWVYELKTRKLSLVGGPAGSAALQFAKLSPDGTLVGFIRDHNLYVQDLATGKTTPLTTDGSATTINGTSDWVYEEELDLRDAWSWSPDSKAIAYWQFDTRGVSEFTLIDNTDTLYPKIQRFAYPKAGQQNSACRVGVVSATGGPTRWLLVPGDPRNHYIARMDWADNATEIVLQQLNRLQNANLVLLADARSGKVTTLLAERDGAWVDIQPNGLEWFDGGRQFTWVSERDGWRHVFAVSRDGGTVRRLTSGDFDVIDVVKVDEAGGWLYYRASPDNSTQAYLYRVPLGPTPGEPERLTPATSTGFHQYVLAPNAAWAVHTWSSFGVPPRTELVSLPRHQSVRVLLDNAALSKKVTALKRGSAEFFRVDIGDGVQLDGYLMKPPDFQAGKRYPLLFHVYGEPAGLEVQDTWQASTYLWHLMLTQQGYLVACVDNRGTPAPRGRDWRKCVYRKLGVLPAQDQANAARALGSWPYVDPQRIGIWGWSGGGSMSLNALFRYPDVYRLAMAVAPVPDVHLYDTIYQERYLGLPEQNAEDYKQASPITFAGNLKGNLLIVHGTGDDNVHYQGTEKLLNALIAANKPFTMMAYPNRTHAIAEGAGTRRHLFELLTRYLHEHLPAGPRAP
jgi:dipeptidyl-peptidase-4